MGGEGLAAGCKVKAGLCRGQTLLPAARAPTAAASALGCLGDIPHSLFPAVLSPCVLGAWLTSSWLFLRSVLLP